MEDSLCYFLKVKPILDGKKNQEKHFINRLLDIREALEPKMKKNGSSI